MDVVKALQLLPRVRVYLFKELRRKPSQMGHTPPRVTKEHMRYTKHLLASLTIGLPLVVWGAMPATTVHAAQQTAPVAVQPVAQAAQDPGAGMPDGPGKDITVKTCTKCHSITNVTGAHKDTDGWTATITKMVGYGATGSDDDFQAILDYVSKNYGLTPPPASSTPPPTGK